MKQFYSPYEIDYSPLIEFLNELDDVFDDSPLHEKPVRFGFRFEEVNNKTSIEIIQSCNYHRLFSMTLTLDGDDDLIESFLRAFDSKIYNYTPLSDVAKKIDGLSVDEIAFRFKDILEDANKFYNRLFKLNDRAKQLYKDKKNYYDLLIRDAQLRLHGFN